MKTRQISGIFNASLASVPLFVRNEFAAISGKTLQTKFVGNSSGLRQAEPALSDQQSGVKLAYPFALFVVAEMSLDTEKAGLKKNLATGGHNVGLDADNGTIFIENLRPVKVGIGVNFRSDSQKDLIEFSHALLFNAPRIGFTMEGDHGFKIGISLYIDPTFSLPPTNFESPGDGYQFEFVMSLNTYIGYSSTTKAIRNIVINNQITGEKILSAPELTAFNDMSSTINYLDYYDKNSPLYKGNKD